MEKHKMLAYSLEYLDDQLVFFNSIKEDYLYNFSLELGQPLIGPRTLQIVLTTRCNLRCEMCHSWKFQKEDIDNFYIKKIIDDTYKIGNLKEVLFTGGEALLRSDIFDLIKYVKGCCANSCTILNTNGLLLTRENIDNLIDAKLDILSISIDSPVPEIHNSLRGKHVLERVIEALNYINAEKKRRNIKFPRLVVCSVLMDQTLDTMSDMIDFCVKYNIENILIQPYVSNDDFAFGRRRDKFWIHKRRLPLLQDILEKIDSKKGKIPGLYIEAPVGKIYKYFSEPVFVDKCYAGFTHVLLVGKSISFICSGQDIDEYKFLGFVGKDSVDELWFSEKANYIRGIIKACKKNCVQFCAIRPSSDLVTKIHQRLVEQKNLFLLFREVHFLEECITKYPNLPIKEIIEQDYNLIRENLEALLNSIDNLESNYYPQEPRQYLLRDLKLIDTHLRNTGNAGYPLSMESRCYNRSFNELDILENIIFYKRLLKNALSIKEQ